MNNIINEYQNDKKIDKKHIKNTEEKIKEILPENGQINVENIAVKSDKIDKNYDNEFRKINDNINETNSEIKQINEKFCTKIK